jgi:hypothetical protein
MGKIFLGKVTSGGITKEKIYATNAFLWGKFAMNNATL